MIRIGEPRLPRPLVSLLIAATLCACAQEGDFGRPAKGVWNGLVETTGAIAARERGLMVSGVPLTDDEEILRDRAWRFLMPAQGRAAFEDVLANLTRVRALPVSWRPNDLPAYHDGLLGEGFRSPYSRYRRLSEDATADGRLIPAFAAVAARVFEADALRLRALPLARSLDEEAMREAALRVAENRCLVAWMRLETGLRAARYRYALEHFLAEMPGREAVPAEQSLAFLDGRRRLLDPLLPPEAAERCGLAEAAALALAPPVVAKY